MNKSIKISEEGQPEGNTSIIIDIEFETVFGKPFGKRIWWHFPAEGKNMQELIEDFKRANPNGEKHVVQYIDTKTGETIKGPKYDTTEMEVASNLKAKLDVQQQPPIEPSQHEPRDRFMNEAIKFRKMVKDCIKEIKQENDPRYRLKESLRAIVKEVLSEGSSNSVKPEPTKDDVETQRKGYDKKGNERLDKSNEKLQQELETIIHGIDPKWEVYWDDHGQLVVRAQNLLYVRIAPKFENNYDIDAMVKLVDRVRAVSQTWDQVKAFIKANFGDLKNTTKADDAKKKALDHYEDREVIKKDAGPETQKVPVRYQDPKNPSVKDTKKDDKNYNEPMTKRDEDMPDQPMKKVTEPGKDPESKNKNIEKTEKVKPPKHKNDNKLKASDKKTPKFVKKQVS